MDVFHHIRRAAAPLAVAAALAATPATALGQSSTEGYGGDNSVVAALDEGNGGGGDGNAGANSGLPFTGGDLSVLAGAGGLMLALGFGMRQLTRRPA